jgi:hypothetical protein
MPDLPSCHPGTVPARARETIAQIGRDHAIKRTEAVR